MRFFSSRPLALTLALGITLSACDSAQDTPSAADLTADEIAEVTQIVADAVAEDTGGLFASASDATASVTEDGLEATAATVRGRRDRRLPCRSRATVAYDASTGTHTVTYACDVRTAGAQRTYAANLAYQFRDATGGFIPRPAQNRDTVATVGFTGTASGSTRFARRNATSASAFDQSSQWNLTGLNAGGAPASFSVQQQRSGTQTRTARGRSSARSFTTQFSGSDILITPATDGAGASAVGQLAYTVTVEVTRNGRTETRVAEGTVDLETNGRALLRVLGVPTLFRFSLGDGAVSPA